MIAKHLSALMAAALCLIVTNGCVAGEVLFYKVSRNYGHDGLLGRVNRRELETRMFTHATWSERLYCNPYEPDIDETLEVHSNADGSRSLSHRLATPSLSRRIDWSISQREQFDLKKKLDAVRITEHEIALPAEVAKEIELLWRTMLPGLLKEPTEPIVGEHRLIIHAPYIIALARDNNSVKTGSIAMAAYNTPAYVAFMGIVDDLIKVCDRGGSSADPIFRRLPDKIRHLRTRL